MKSFIRNLSAPAEFCLIIVICFWWGIIGSARQLADHLLQVVRAEPINNSVVLWVVIMQLFVMAMAFWIGHIRGWSLATFGARLSWKWTGAGILLFLVSALVIIVSIMLTNIIAPGARNPAHIVSGVAVSGLTLPFLILFSIVNPIYEEVMGTGYVIHSLQRYGTLPAILASALFRSFLHSYQGLDAIVIVLPLGIALGFFYWKWRQLWPFIVAHVIFDLWPLLAFIHAI
jgi:uncharacterized protein